MRLLTYLLVGLLVSGLDVFLFKSENIKEKIKVFLGHTIGINTLSLFLMRYVLDKPFVLNLTNYKTLFVVKYVIFSLVIGVGILFLKGLITQQLIITKNTKKLSLMEKIISGLAVVFVLIGSFLWIGTVWFIDYFGKLTPEQFIFNFKSPVTGTASGVMDNAINGPVLLFISVAVAFIFFILVRFNLEWKNKTVISDKLFKYIGIIFSIGLLIYGAFYSIKELQLKAVYHAYFDDSSYIKDNYQAPKDTKLTFPEKKRNLIHIYLESYENTYFATTSGGYMEKNLMPDFEKLYEEGISFSDNDKKGGPYQTYGSSWSVASMVNMSTGLPLKVPMDGNSYGKTGYFLPGAGAIGDILHDEGYNQTIMFGADADFGGLTSFFNNHKDFHIYDWKYAKEIGKIPNDYKVWWGYEDKKLYEYAQEEILRLAAEDKPFNFTMENADTHFPDGFLEKDAPTPFDKQYSNVIFHSQKQIYDFVKWIQAQDFYDNTTIVLTGDHLSMDKKYFVDFDPNYHRTTTNLIINPVFENDNIKTTNRHFAPFDMYPTVLSSMGVDIEGHKLGLGVDLSSNEKTLIERDSLKTVNEELSKNSQFYNKEFVSEPKKKK
ncbi:LTA synthase family protein [Vagococcus fluvialis]|uniref:LTA synthase family protein n=1 Tax=Vagococcus fluvialis TaxID=2738 RepID=UPI003D14B424